MRILILSFLGTVSLFLLSQSVMAEDPNVVFKSATEIVLIPFDQALDRIENQFKRTANPTVDCCANPQKCSGDLSGCRKSLQDLCANLLECYSHPPDYRIIYTGTADNYPAVPTIDQVFVDDISNETLHLVLSGPISLARTCTDRELQELSQEKAPCVYDLSDFKIFIRRVVMGKKKEAQGFEISIAPTVTDDYGTRESILYRGTHRSEDVPDSTKVTVKVVDVDTKRDIPTKVVKVESASKTKPGGGQSNWRILLDPPLERGRTLAVTVSGIEKYNDSDMTAQGKIAVQAYPKGRDDAVFYLRGQKSSAASEKIRAQQISNWRILSLIHSKDDSGGIFCPGRSEAILWTFRKQSLRRSESAGGST